MKQAVTRNTPDGSRTESSGPGYFAGAFNGADQAVKDTKRFAATADGILQLQSLRAERTERGGQTKGGMRPPATWPPRRRTTSGRRSTRCSTTEIVDEATHGRWHWVPRGLSIRATFPPERQLAEETSPMKAIVVTDQAAGTAGMKLMERPDPQAAINDVVVQVHASGFVPT